MEEFEFYIGKGGALYLRRENGSLSRFGIRFTTEGVFVFDQLLRRWYLLPESVPDRAGGSMVVRATKED